MKQNKLNYLSLIVALSGLLMTACGDDDGPADTGMDTGTDTGTDVQVDTPASEADLTVLLGAEETIADGIAAGTDGEDITDGWAADFSMYAVALGPVELVSVSDQSEYDADETVVIDLRSVSESGDPTWSFNGLPTGRYSFFFDQVVATTGATRNDSVSEADFQSMVDGECSYLIRGAISKADGVTCLPDGAMPPAGGTPDENGCYANTEVSFEFCANAPVEFGPCELDEMEEIVVNAGGSSVAITMHGDHMFFNGFPEGDEGGVTRLAQWLADCDLNLDGMVTQEELESIELSDLAEIDERYELGGAPTLPGEQTVMTAWDYVRAQLMTQGHFGGEGECAINGEAHDH